MSRAEELRAEISKRRDALTLAERSEKSEQIWKRLVELPEFRSASQALFYVSFKSEVETSIMREMARELGMQVAAPRGDRQTKGMAFYHLDSDDSLESGPYGILQPPANAEDLVDFEVPTVVLVPGIVFDLKCNRLGWGGGYYDRFLAGEGKGLPCIGLAFDCQVLESVPVETHDVPVDLLVTESRTVRKI